MVSFWLKSPAEVLAPYFAKEVRVIGYIEPLSVRRNEDRVSFVLDCEEIAIGSLQIDYKDKLRVYQVNKGDAVLHKSAVSDAGRVMVAGKLEELRSFANPGGFNSTSYNWVQGLGGMVRKAQVQVLEDKPRLLDYFGLLNMKLRELVENSAGDSAPLLNGMVLGGSNGLSTETRESFSANGLSHLLSVSGTHLILLASFLRLLFKQFKLQHSNWLLFLFLAGYACLCGLKPPVLRALCMSSVLMWGKGSQAERSRIFCMLIMLFLAYKPVWILDLGFQLSFSATAGLLWLLPKLKLRLEGWFGSDSFITEGMAVTMAAQLASLPILVGNFYTVSLISIVSNILLVPILELSTILTLIGMFMSYIFAPLGSVFLKLAAWLTEQIIVQAGLLQAIPFSTIVVGSLPSFCGVIYYALLIVALDLPLGLLLTSVQRKAFILAGSLVIFSCYAWRQWLPIPTTIYFLDVGQGDAAVIVSPDHRVAVIDTGGLPSYDTGARILTPFLHSLGKSEVDVFIPTHGDSDHIGGSAGLARNVKIKSIVMSMEDLTKENIALYEGLIKNASKANIIYANRCREIDLGGAVLRIVEPLEYKLKGNDASTVVEVEDVKTGAKALFTGDMSSRREYQLTNIERYDVLKVSHHGSKSSTSEVFLERVQPKLAVISCGLNNMYGHPHRMVVERLKDFGTVVARTDLQGCIKVEFTDNGISWQGYRE